jgi:hypothetical protein
MNLQGTRQAERSWLKSRARSESVPVNYPETDKGRKQLDKNMELAGWYQTVPYLRLESQLK